MTAIKINVQNLLGYRLGTSTALDSKLGPKIGAKPTSPPATAKSAA